MQFPTALVFGILLHCLDKHLSIWEAKCSSLLGCILSGSAFGVHVFCQTAMAFALCVLLHCNS